MWEFGYWTRGEFLLGKYQGGDQLNSIQSGAFVDGIDDRQP